MSYNAIVSQYYRLNGSNVNKVVSRVCVKDLVGLFLNVNNHGGLVRVAPNMFITACEAGVAID